MCSWFTLFSSNKYYVATNTWHHQIMFHFLLRSYLPTLVISNQIFVQYCSSNVSLFAALHSLNGLYKCMELSQQFATFMKLALVCRIYICLFTFQRTVPPWKTSISTVDKLCKLVPAVGSWNEFPILIQLLADGGQWHLQYILISELCELFFALWLFKDKIDWISSIAGTHFQFRKIMKGNIFVF